MDQRPLAEVSGVSVHTVSNIETGAGNPRTETLARIASALGLELDLRTGK